MTLFMRIGPTGSAGNEGLPAFINDPFMRFTAFIKHMGNQGTQALLSGAAEHLSRQVPIPAV